MNKSQNSKTNLPSYIYLLGVILLITSCVVGYLLFSKSETIDPAYWAKYLQYPSVYPIEEAKMIKDSTYLIVSIGIGLFLCGLCCSLAKIVELLDEIKAKDYSPFLTAAPVSSVSYCPNCGEKISD